MHRLCVIGLFLWISAVVMGQKSIDVGTSHGVEIAAPMPLDMSPPLNTMREKIEMLDPSVFDIPQPVVSLVQPTVEMPKGAPEIHDIPHANIAFSGNVLKEKKVVLNIPSPVIEAPKPIVQTKPALFRVPQPIFVIPSPVVQHKPMIYKVPHTLIVHRPEVNLKQFHVAIPQLKVVKGSKSAYTQPIPAAHNFEKYHNKVAHVSKVLNLGA